jgi:predicted kinase
MIVIVLGLPGSGKSYFASRLARMLGADYVNSDRLRKELFPKRTYSAEEKSKVYEAMFQKMEEAIAHRKNLVLDATFHKNATRKQFMNSIKRKEQLFFIEVQAEENTIKQRLKKSRPYSEANFEVYKLIQKQWEPLQIPHLTIESTNDNIDRMLQEAVQYLNHEPKSNR